MGLAAGQPLSPELVLVCPELRAHALELLPARDPDALFDVVPRPTPKLLELRPVSRPRQDFPAVAERRPAPPVAVAAYFAEAIVLGALRGAAMIAAVASVAFLLAR